MPELPEKLILLILQGFGLGIVTIALAFAWSRLSQRFNLTAPSMGLMVGIAFLAGEMTFHSATLRGWIAVFLLAGMRLMRPRTQTGRIAIRTICIFFSAAILASWSIDAEPWWLRVLVIPACVFLVPSTERLNEHHFAEGLVPLLILFTAAGVLTIVPDTEEIALLFGLLLSTTLSVQFFHLSFFDKTGTAPLIGLLIWVICVDGQGRPASVLASAGCLGLLVAEPILNAITSSRLDVLNRFSPGRPLRSALLLHCFSIAIVLVMARTTSSLLHSAAAALAAISIPAVALVLRKKRDLEK